MELTDALLEGVCDTLALDVIVGVIELVMEGLVVVLTEGLLVVVGVNDLVGVSVCVVVTV